MTTLLPADLQTVQQHYDAGRYLQAYEASQAIGPLASWRGAAGRVLAGRLAGNLGSGRLAQALHMLAYREHPSDSDAVYFRAQAQLSRWGPYFTLRWIDRLGEVRFDDPGRHAEWVALQARCHALLRDRERADRDLAEALSIAPGRRWLAVERAGVCEYTDRYEEGLDVILDCLESNPGYRPALQSATHLLNLSGRTDEAIDLLEGASSRLEAGALHCQLGSLYHQEQRNAQAREQYELGAKKMPLLDKRTGDAWLARIRSDLASAFGEPDEALRLLETIPDHHKGHFHKRVEASLRDRPADAKRELLDLPFIRQHYRTCAPATLAMIARFWDRPAEHMEIADAICFDGTPYHAERQWAEEAGYLVAEFTVDFASTKALIDRGVPFTFSTVEPGNGHLQAVVGYDQTRNTLLLRDPFYPTTGEVLAESLEERYGPYGPRGMLLVPPDRADLIDGLDLTDRALWEQTHAARAALITHDRDTAVRTIEAMRDQAPTATLTLNAELSLADYDNDADARSRLVEALIERYPKCPAIVPRRLDCMSERGLRHERLALLREACDREDASALLIHRLAEELAEDAREAGRAEWHLRRLIRSNPRNADAYNSLANMLWARDERREAARLYRYAACIEDTREHHALTLFRAMRHFREEDGVLNLLADRFDRMGDKDAGPARTLYEAHRLMARADLGFEVLDRAIERRPDDGALMLFAARERSAFGQQERAAGLLEQARTRSRHLDWQRTAATLAEDAGRLAEARDHWWAVIERSPLDLYAHARWCGLTRRIEGHEKAVAHMRAMVERFPHHWDLQRDLYVELSDHDRDAALPLLRQLVERLPNNAWAWRELAFLVVEMPDGLEEAKHAIDRAKALNPDSPGMYNLLGRHAELTGDTAGAIRAYRESIRLDPDGSYAIERLIEQYDDRAGRRDAMRAVLDELTRQVTFGEGVLTYQRVAGRALTQDELLADLRTACDERPDLWQVWAALIDQLLLSDQPDHAADAAKQATERFPLVPNVWFRRAEVHRVRLEPDEQVRFLEEALRIAPDYPAAVIDLAAAYEHTARPDDAEQVLRRALDREPRSVRFHAQLADLYWHTGRPEPALSHIDQAIRLAPDDYRCWGRIIDWSARVGDKQAPAELARALTQERPADPNIWITLAEVLNQPRDLDERLAAIDRALSLDPRLPEAYDLKARVLVSAHRYDDALEACDPPAFAGRPPFNLRGRACWIEHRRGNTDHAMQAMWRIIDEEPTYLWALKELIEWCHDAGDFDGQVRAAGLLIQADPNDHVALGYRAFARMNQSSANGISSARRNELRAQAKADFSRAVALNPGYDYGADRLFNLHLEDNELDQAQQVLDRCGEFMEADARLAMRVALASKRGDKQAAERALRELCALPSDEAWAYQYAYDFAHKLGVAEPAILEMSRQPGANPLVGMLLVRPLVDRGTWPTAAKRCKMLRDWPEGWDKAATYLLEAIAQRGSQTHHRKLLASFYKQNRQRLRDAPDAWNAAIYALASMDLSFPVIELFAGWQQRDDLEPWMLCNLANAYLTLGQLDRAYEVVAAALDMPPDHSRPNHLIDLAHLLALRGDARGAKQALDQVIVEQMPDFYQHAYHLARALSDARLAPNPAQARATARQHLANAKACFPHWRQNIGQRRCYRRVVRALGPTGGLVGRALALSRLLAS
ncbi:MAG: tetratricopeptide repeat protein [Phycisphaeraceae bacterium]